MIKKVLIVASKTNIDFKYFDNDETYIIGVERGCLDLIEKGIKIDFAISDFDKVIDEELELIKSHAKEISIQPEAKDYLDGELAILKAKEFENAKIFFIANPTKRYDKNFSIFGMIFKYDINFINDDTTMLLIKKGTTELNYDNYQQKTYVSFFSKKPTMLKIEKMVYPYDSTLEAFSNDCISNAFIPYTNPIITCDEDVICIMTK